jgi:hypothetical protein
MKLFKKLFGRSRESLEDLCERIDESDVDRVSCMDIVRTIRSCVAGFKHPKGMVVVLLEGCRVRIFVFDGIARTSWGYNNQQFSTDRIGQSFLVGPPMEFALTVNTESLLTDVLRREFGQHEMSIGSLWKLDPTAWDYEVMKVLHSNDFGIRISFDHVARS